jgi:hypothetical protein
MKKIILSLSVFAVTGVFAQKVVNPIPAQGLEKTAPKTTTAVQPINKVMNTLWTDDFSNPATWTIDNSGQSGATFGWNINSTREGWWSTNPTGMSTTGTSGGNNAELVNGNPTLSPGTQALGVTYTMTTANAIDIASLGGTNQVSLQFKQFGARFNDLQQIQISTDGTNFVTVGDNLDKDVLSQSGGAAYPNPETKIINLATFLSANPTSVWVRFSWTTNFPSSATNPNVWVVYGWYIDDVKIITNPNSDLTVASNFWGTTGLNYYQIPTTQVAPIEVTSSVFNGGLNNLTGAFLKADVLSGANNVFSGTSPVTPIASLDSADLTLSTTFTPPATVASYTLKRNISLGYLPNGQVLTGALTNGGVGYVSGNNITTTGGTGTGATVNIIASSNGVVGTGSVSAVGTGYSSSTGNATTGGTGTGLTLDITANVGTGDIATAVIGNGGSNYIVGDVVTISGGNGDATYTVSSITGGTVTAVVLNSVGTGYAAGDVLTITGGTATYTVATVTNNTEITDEVPANNTIADVNFAVTNYVYARDNGTFSGSTSNGTDGFEVGNLFDIFADQTIKGINVRLAGGTGGTTVGTEVSAKLYSIDPATGDFIFMEETAPLVVASNNLNTILTMVLLSPQNLVAGETYLAVVGSFDSGLKVSNAGTSEVQTSFFKDLATDTWFYTTSTPVVRLNFDPVLGVNDLNSQVTSTSIYPNPTSTSSTVEFNLATSSEVSMTVTDLSGKVVSERNLGQLNAGANSSVINTAVFTNGIYYVTVKSNGTAVTKKLIKN